MEENTDIVKKLHWYSNFPKWLKVVLLIISILTLVYWLGLITFKILSAIRYVGAFLFDKRNYWTFIVTLLIIGISAILLAQFYFNLDPIGKLLNWAEQVFNDLRNSISDIIKG